MSIGVDLIEIERVEAALARRPRLAERLFTEAEVEHCAARARPARHLAARFAAKEAVSKALNEPLRPREIEVVGSEPPRIVLHGMTARLAADRGLVVDVSLSHSRELAGAVALARTAAA